MSFQRLGIAAKVWMSVGIFVVGYIVSTAFNQIHGIQTENQLEIASKTLFPSAQLTQDSEAGFQRMTRAFSDALMVEDAAGLEQAQKEGESIAARLASAAQLPGMTPAQAAELRRLSDTIRTLAGDARAAYGSMIGSGGNLTEQMQTRSRDIAARTATAKDALSKLRQSMSAELRDGLAETAASSARQRTLSLVVFALALLIAGAAVHLTVQRAILGPVGRIATGIGEATRTAMDAAERMAVAGDRVNKGAAEQAACVEETTASLTEILATTQQNVARAAEADKLMSDATTTVTESTAAVDNLTRSMHEIAQASQQVSGVLKSINEIAFQTNLLALNAAVEAARAGAAGAGFAVVAEEVRALAARTAEAARNSAALIEQAGEKVTQGVQYVDATRRAFGDLAQVVTASGQVVSEIATSTEEQAKSINYINTAMSRIEQVAQTNTANAHETAESAALVNEQVRATQHHISWFAESWPGA